jgi:hypothetical protein
MAPEQTNLPASNDRQALERALAELQGSASQFSASCIRDAQARMR